MEQIGTHWNNMEHFGTHQEGQRMQDTNQDKNQIAESEPQPLEPSAIYQNNIYALVDDVKQEPRFNNKTDEELKQDKSFFPLLVNYIYNNYIGNLLDNKHCKPQLYTDIKQIDYLFNIYIDLVYKYKWNNRPLIIEFSIFTGINRDTFYNWLNGNNNNSDTNTNSKYLTRERSDIVQKWVGVCERALIDGNDTIKDIFILKAKHGYRDNNNDINITVNHKQIVTSEELPALIGVDNGNN